MRGRLEEYLCCSTDSSAACGCRLSDLRYWGQRGRAVRRVDVLATRSIECYAGILAVCYGGIVVPPVSRTRAMMHGQA